MFCQRCGKELPAHTFFCPFCDARTAFPAPGEPFADGDKYADIGGWLIPLLITLFLSIVFSFPPVIVLLHFTITLYPASILVKTALLLAAAIFVLRIVSFRFFLKASRCFRMVFTVMASCGVLLIPIVLCMPKPDASLGSAVLFYIALNLAPCIWIPYLFLSRRVDGYLKYRRIVQNGIQASSFAGETQPNKTDSHSISESPPAYPCPAPIMPTAVSPPDEYAYYRIFSGGLAALLVDLCVRALHMLSWLLFFLSYPPAAPEPMYFAFTPFVVLSIAGIALQSLAGVFAAQAYRTFRLLFLAATVSYIAYFALALSIPLFAWNPVYLALRSASILLEAIYVFRSRRVDVYFRYYKIVPPPLRQADAITEEIKKAF